MNAGFYTFDEVLLELKNRTGITNLRNHYDDIENMIKQAEREINPYSGHLIRKKMIFWKGGANFDGTIIKKPKDFVSIDKIGSCQDGLCPGQYRETKSHIIICDKTPREKIIWTYWGYQCDGSGRILTTRNHASAVIEYILYCFASQRYFMREGSLNEVDYHKNRFDWEASASRGADFFPDNVEMEILGQLNTASPMIIQQSKIKAGNDCCLASQCLYTYEDQKPEEGEVPIENTPPEVDDNSAFLQYLYNFGYGDFTKNYFDAQNHPPGKWILKGNTNMNIGKFYFGQTATSSLPLSNDDFPFERSFSEINKLRYILNHNVRIVDDRKAVLFNGINNLVDYIQDRINMGYSVFYDNNDITFRKEVVVSNEIDSDFFVIYDVTNSTYGEVSDLKNIIQATFEEYKSQYSFYQGNFYFIVVQNERWLQASKIPYTGERTEVSGYEEIEILPENFGLTSYWPRLNPVVLFLGKNSHPHYHDSNVTYGFTTNIKQPTLTFLNDYKEFDHFYKNIYTSFRGYIIPLIKLSDPSIAAANQSAFSLHVLAVLEGDIIADVDVYNSPFDLSLLESENPYKDFEMDGYPNMVPLKNIGWSGRFDVLVDGGDISDIFEDFIGNSFDDIVETEIEEFTVSGTEIDINEIKFPFSVKEQSSDELESNQQEFSFYLKEVVSELRIWTFQFETDGLDINNVDLITDGFISENCFEHTLSSLLLGKNINFFYKGRRAFVLLTETENQYKILGTGDVDITSTFDKVYLTERKLEIYIEKNPSTPPEGVTYYKLEEI